MKKLFLLVFGFMATISMFGQDVVILGLNADGPDQFTFVATADIPAATIIFFTDEPFDCETNSFDNNGNGNNSGVLSFITTQQVLNGDIVSIQFNNPGWDVLTGQGIALEVANDLNMQFQTTLGDRLYAFTAFSNTNPSGTVTNISSVVETIAGTMPTSEDPKCEYPSAVCIDFTVHQDNFDYTGPRDGTTVGDLANIGNYTQSDDRIDLNIADFTSSALPVALISFEAKKYTNSEINLTWSTASEENNSHFEVEHSTNGRDFEAIGKVTGNGTSSEKQQYHYMHERAAAGKNYYRLRQVDFDGAFEYSPVAVVKLRGEGTVQIRPTLADEQVSLVFEEATRQEAQLQVFDITGRQITTALVTPGTEQFELPVANFTEGLYFIQLQLNGEFTTLKFIKR